MGGWSRSGETSAAPKGVEHKSSAASEVKLMLIEPKGAVNTSDAGRDEERTRWMRASCEPIHQDGEAVVMNGAPGC